MALYPKFFKHDATKKYVIAFGQLFNGIDVVRYNTAGVENHRVRVPLTYGPKEKFYVRNTQDPNVDRPAAIQLPRMAFEIIGYGYAGERKQQNNIKLRYRSNNPNQNTYVFHPVPWDILFNLYTITKSADEMAQIIEQILPMFTPDYTVAVKLVPEADITTDIPITLSGMDVIDKYEGNFIERREIVSTISFTMKGWFYGPTRTGSLIKEVDTNIIDIDSLNRYANIDIKPNPLNATPVDDFGFTTTITEAPSI